MQVLTAYAPTVKPLSRPTTPTGQFTRITDPCAITRVYLPSGALAWQVGPHGRIYADRDAAIAWARVRAERGREYLACMRERANRAGEVW